MRSTPTRSRLLTRCCRNWRSCNLHVMRARLPRLALPAALLLAGCAAPSASVHQPMSARPAAAPAAAPVDGAIYQASAARPLFEDRRARHVGDTLTIYIAEKTSASKKSNSSASRSGGLDFSVPTVQGLPGKTFQGATLKADSSNKFEGEGESAAANDFSGTITVTVIEVLTNGNLLVSGEKQLALNQGSEFIRFSGVVNPNNINAANTVSSAEVADARIEYKANGYIAEAQVVGWLARFFLTFLPYQM